jgi:integrase/recombinase XerD
MEQAIQQFILSLAANRGASRNTLGAYQTDLRQLEDYLRQEGITAWSQARPAHLADFVAYLREREYAPTSIARKAAAVKSFFRALGISGAIPEDPAHELALPRVERDLPQTLAADEVARLFRHIATATPAGLRDDAMLRLLYSTGLRVSEIVALALTDLDADLAHVRVAGRNGRARVLPVSPPARAALADYLERGRPLLARNDSPRPLFLNHHGAQLTRQGFWLIMKGHARAAGIAHITPHTLRHSFALALVDRGVELRDVQELLGHANLSTTQVYRHLQRAQLGPASVGMGIATATITDATEAGDDTTLVDVAASGDARGAIPAEIGESALAEDISDLICARVASGRSPTRG